MNDEVLRSPSPGHAMNWLGHTPPRVPVVAVVGDSLAFSLNQSLAVWLFDSGQGWPAPGWSAIGCGLLMPDFLKGKLEAGEDVRSWTRPRQDGFYTRKACVDGADAMRERVLSDDPDLVVSAPSVWDLAGLPSMSSGEPERLGNPRVDAKLRQLMDERILALSSQGATVVWLTLPVFSPPGALPMGREEICLLYTSDAADE